MSDFGKTQLGASEGIPRYHALDFNYEPADRTAGTIKVFQAIFCTGSPTNADISSALVSGNLR